MNAASPEHLANPLYMTFPPHIYRRRQDELLSSSDLAIAHCRSL